MKTNEITNNVNHKLSKNVCLGKIHSVVRYIMMLQTDVIVFT